MEGLQPKVTYRPKSKLETFFTGGSVKVLRNNQFLACACADEVKDSEPITALAVSPDCRTLVSASRSLACKVWDITSGDCSRTWKAHKSPVADVAIDASGGYCATASADRSVKVWDLAGGYCTHSFAGHSGVVLRVLFHPKQLMLYSCSDDADVRVWDLVAKTCVATLKGHCSAVTALSLSPDGWLLLSAGRDNVVGVWDLRTHSKVNMIPVFEALEGVVALPLGLPYPGAPSAAVDKGGRAQRAAAARTVCFATAGERGVVKIWRSDTAACAHVVPRDVMGGAFVGAREAAGAAPAGADDVAAPGSELMDLALLPGGRGLLAVTGDARLLFLTPQEASQGVERLLRLERQLVGHLDEVTDVRWLGPPGGPTALAVATNSEAVRVFTPGSMGCLGSLLGHREVVLTLEAVRLSDGRDLLVSGSKDREVRAWDGARGACLGVAAGHVGAVAALALARKLAGSFLASGGGDKLIKVWDLRPLLKADWSALTGPLQLTTLSATAAHDKHINALAVAPNDTLLASASQDRTVKLWRLPSLAPVATLRGHKRGVWSVEFSPVDQVLLTASGDKTLKLWSIRDGACLRTFEGHTATVLRAAFVTAGTQAVSTGADGLLKLWSTRTGECLNSFDAHEDKVWALAAGGAQGALLATGGSDARVVVWEDTTAADAAQAAEEEGQLAVAEQELQNALVDADYAAAARLAFELKHPGRLLSVLRRAGAQGGEGREVLASLVAHMPPEGLQTALEYCREWNTNARNCHVAQAMLHAILVSTPPEKLLAVPGIRSLLDALLAYSERHMARVDRLMRASFLLDVTLSASGVLLPEGETQDLDEAAAAVEAPSPTAKTATAATAAANAASVRGANGRASGGGGGAAAAAAGGGDDLGSDDFVSGSASEGSGGDEGSDGEGDAASDSSGGGGDGEAPSSLHGNGVAHCSSTSSSSASEQADQQTSSSEGDDAGGGQEGARTGGVQRGAAAGAWGLPRPSRAGQAAGRPLNGHASGAGNGKQGSPARLRTRTRAQQPAASVPGPGKRVGAASGSRSPGTKRPREGA